MFDGAPVLRLRQEADARHAYCLLEIGIVWGRSTTQAILQRMNQWLSVRRRAQNLLQNEANDETVPRMLFGAAMFRIISKPNSERKHWKRDGYRLRFRFQSSELMSAHRIGAVVT